MFTIEHTALSARDTGRLAKWYQDVLGFPIVYESAGSPKAYFVQDKNGMAIEIVPPGNDGSVRDAHATHLALWVDDFDAAAAELRQKGVALEAEMTNEFFGGTRIQFFTDPEGHRIQIIARKVKVGEKA